MQRTGRWGERVGRCGGRRNSGWDIMYEKNKSEKIKINNK